MGSVSSGLDTQWVHPHGLVLSYAQRKWYFQDYLLKFFCLVILILKKRSQFKTPLKILFCVFYTLSEFKIFKWCLGADCYGNCCDKGRDHTVACL